MGAFVRSVFSNEFPRFSEKTNGQLWNCATWRPQRQFTNSRRLLRGVLLFRLRSHYTQNATPLEYRAQFTQRVVDNSPGISRNSRVQQNNRSFRNYSAHWGNNNCVCSRYIVEATFPSLLSWTISQSIHVDFAKLQTQSRPPDFTVIENSLDWSNYHCKYRETVVQSLTWKISVFSSNTRRLQQ